ncbi:MAG: urease accessory protein UreH domain-containing protein [bacterium]
MVNLYNPQNFSSVFSILITAFLLGIVHGFTPDEHTWPITFSYSIGSYSTKGGFKTGLLFSLAFTFQRAVASELSYYALGKILTKPDVVPVIYIFVGIIMSFAGAYIIGLGENFELFEGLEKILLKFLKIKPQMKHANEKSRPIPIYMVLLHGFIAGWGTGAFAIIVYTVLAPKMPNAYTGFLPGLLFGLGTMATQIIIGMFVGRFMERLNIPKKGIEYIARRTSGLTLFWGGLAFVFAAALEIAFPRLIQMGFITPIKVHNLHNLGVGFFLVIFIILFILTTSFIKSLKYVKNNGSEFK